MQNEDNKDAVLASTDTANQPNQDVSTIKATELIDNTSSKESKDLSAIIPQDTIQGSEASNTLLSKNKELSSDGSVVIGNINENGLTMVEGANYPNKIDVAARKKAQQEAIKAKKDPKQKKKKEMTDEAKKAQNITTMVVIIAAVVLGLFGYYLFNRNTDDDFIVKRVTVELGNPLPKHTKDYVSPANLLRIGSFDFSSIFKTKEKIADDLLYTVNTSEVRIDEVGEYEFTVYHNGITKRGYVEVVDTTPPKVETIELHIMAGSEYGPEKFIKSCVDLSGCIFEFKDENLSKFTEPGLYNKDNNNMIVVVSDPYDNKVEIGVTLYIESNANVKRYQKNTPFNNLVGYSLRTTYEVYFSSLSNSLILSYANKIDTYTYLDDNLFNEEVNRRNGEKETTYNRDNKTITITTKVTSIIGSSNNTASEIDKYLINNGFAIIN